VPAQGATESSSVAPCHMMALCGRMHRNVHGAGCDMSQNPICNWLGLPDDGWPPDHYKLLGLEPGESDAALIEQRVHQRLDSVRRYQMMHPDQATEAMNRLAQAFVCLTDPAARRAYDEQMQIARPRPRPIPPPVPVSPAATPPPAPRDPHVWLYT